MLWLTNLLLEERDISSATDAALQALVCRQAVCVTTGSPASMQGA